MNMYFFNKNDKKKKEREKYNRIYFSMQVPTID